MAEILVVAVDDIRETLQGVPELEVYAVGTALVAPMRADDSPLAVGAQLCRRAWAAASRV